MTDRPLAPIDFGTFLVSLASNAMVHLGQGEGDEKRAPNLPLAKQTVDILALLEEKTAGNLTEEEDKLLKTLLYQCRMAYLEAVRGA